MQGALIKACLPFVILVVLAGELVVGTTAQFEQYN
jgi:hypothetical protein